MKKFRNYRCDGLDRQIDALVYELYALSSAEIKIVDGAALSHLRPTLRIAGYSYRSASIGSSREAFQAG